MNNKQERFCMKYLQTLSISEAAKLSGYSAPTGYKLMKKEEIKAYIKTELERIKTDDIAQTQEILEELTKISRSQSAETKDRIKALELLGKTYGIFKPKKEQKIYPTVIITGEAEIKD